MTPHKCMGLPPLRDTAQARWDREMATSDIPFRLLCLSLGRIPLLVTTSTVAFGRCSSKACSFLLKPSSYNDTQFDHNDLVAIMASEPILATAASVIALVALALSTGQLLQQVFSTAGGYRRCQPWILRPSLGIQVYDGDDLKLNLMLAIPRLAKDSVQCLPTRQVHTTYIQ